MSEQLTRNMSGLGSAGLEKVADLLNTSTEAQRQRVLALLMERPRSTFELRDTWNVMMPGARVIELREAGHKIVTIRQTLADRDGRMHPRVAVYVLIRLAGEREVAA